MRFGLLGFFACAALAAACGGSAPAPEAPATSGAPEAKSAESAPVSHEDQVRNDAFAYASNQDIKAKCDKASLKVEPEGGAFTDTPPPSAVTVTGCGHRQRFSFTDGRYKWEGAIGDKPYP